MQSDDQLLWDKVINDAGIRNELVLSLAETNRAKVLLGDAERTLLAMDQIAALLAQRQVYAEQVVAKFRVAVAPIKRLPVELLADIFSHFLPSAAVDGRFYKASLAPWFLGQVCALWRQVSRSGSNLWSVTIDYSKFSTHLVKILPPDISIRLNLLRIFNFDSFIPILHHVKHLRINVDIVQLNMLWRISPESLVKLESLNISIHEYYKDQLPSFDPLYDISHWAQHTPFRLAHNLRTVIIDDSGVEPGALNFGLLILEGLGFLRNEVSSLDLSGIQYLSATMIATYIKKFLALKTLIIRVGPELDGGDDYPSLLLDAFSGLQSLQSLTIKTYNAYRDEEREIESPASLALRAMKPEAWAGLSVLNISHASITDCSVLRQLLTQCGQLTELFFTVPRPLNVFDTVDWAIALPRLKSLHLMRIQHSWMFRSLLTPALSELEIEFAREYRVDMAAVGRMITSSGCLIQDFRLSCLAAVSLST